MALAEGQVQLRGLVMGPGTPYRFATPFNPFARQVRADQAGDRAWADGSYSGAEWTAAAAVPMRLVTLGAGTAGWLALHRQLASAFAPSHTDLELRFMVGGEELLLRGRPRLLEPDARLLDGTGYTNAAFLATDPHVYGATVHQVVLGLPSVIGGLTAPLTAPLISAATVIAGRETLAHAGTAPAALMLRVDGPCDEPRVTLLAGGGSAVLRYAGAVDEGQWLTLDAGRHTAYLNDTASRRGLVSGVWTVLPAAPSPGVSATAEVAFGAATYSATAVLTVSWQDTYQ